MIGGKMIWGQNESRGQNDTRHEFIVLIIKRFPGGGGQNDFQGQNESRGQNYRGDDKGA